MGINVPQQVEYWRAGSEEDLAAALSLLEKGHARHSLFFAHLSLEKLLKAHVCLTTGQVAPRMHNLVLLSQRCGLTMDESRNEFLADMDRFSLSGRYPDAGTPTPSKGEAEAMLSQVQEVLKWLAQQLPR
jgi:HEPN domain-containing protein